MSAALQHTKNPTQFKWVGRNLQGKRIRGHIKAENKLVARVRLHQQGITASCIRKAASSKLKTTDLIYFVRQLGALLGAHVPLIRALDTLIASSDNPRLTQLLNTIKYDLESGQSLADSMRTHSCFDAITCHLITAGEQSAALSSLLLQLAGHKESMLNREQQLKRDLAYPVTLLGLSVCLVMVLVGYVVPQFSILFGQFGATLPAFTQGIINASSISKQLGLGLLFFTVFLPLLGRFFYQQIPPFALFFDTTLLRLPGIRTLIQYAIMARLSATLSMTLRAGIPLFQALDFTTHVAGNQLFQKLLQRVRVRVEEGVSLSKALSESSHFPRFSTQIIAVSEEAGNLETGLSQLAEHYQRELQNCLESMCKYIEPCLMSFIGVLIGTIIIGMYLPIFQLGAII